MKTIKGSKRNVAVTYQTRDIVFGGDYNPSAITNKATYYIQLGEAIFTMDEVNFEEIGRTIKNIKASWEISRA